MGHNFFGGQPTALKPESFMVLNSSTFNLLLLLVPPLCSLLHWKEVESVSELVVRRVQNQLYFVYAKHQG